MVDFTEEQDCYNDCEKVKFVDIVGAKTLSDGGHFGDLLKIARLHINDAKKNGELTEGAAGEVYAKAIEGAMAQASAFGLQRGKMQLDIKLVDAQVKYQEHKLQLEKESFDLEAHIQRAKLSLETQKTYADIKAINATIISSEVKDKQLLQSIKQSQEEVKQIEANILKMKCECENLVASTNSKLDVDKAQIARLDVSNRIEVATSNSKIALERSQSQKIKVDAANESSLNVSKIHLNNNQVAKMKADSMQQHKISTAQANLYAQQQRGFRDNARQKIFETQMQGYAMVFEAGSFGDQPSIYVPNFFGKTSFDATYQNLAERTFCPKTP